MKRILILVTAAWTSVLLPTANAIAQGKTKYVVLITIDGFRPDFYLDKLFQIIL